MKTSLKVCICSFLFFAPAGADINYDSILKTESVSVKYIPLDTIRLYSKLPVYFYLEITNNWLPFTGDPEFLTKRPDNEMKYYFSLVFTEGALYPRCDLLSKAPPPLNITLYNSRKKIIYKKSAPEHAFTFEVGGMPHNDPFFKQIPYTGVPVGTKKTVLVDLRQFFFDVPPGVYTAVIGLQRGYNTIHSHDNEIRIRLHDISDTIMNVLHDEFPDYMENESYVNYEGSFPYYYYYDSTEVGYPLVSKKNLDVHKIRQKLPKDMFSLLSPYFFFNLVYNRCEVNDEAINLLNDFPNYLTPLKLALRYEIAVLQKKSENAQTLKNRIMDEHPGETWRLKDADKGEGLVHMMLKMGRFKKEKQK